MNFIKTSLKCCRLVVFIFFFSLFTNTPSYAQQNGNLADNKPSVETPATPQDHLKSLDQIEKRLKLPALDNNQLDKINAELITLNQFSQNCITTNETEKSRIESALEKLGEPAANEDPEIEKSRRELVKQQGELNKTLSQCRLIEVRSTGYQEQIKTIKQTLLKETLFVPRDSIFRYIIQFVQQPNLWSTEIQQILQIFKNLPINYKNVTQALLYGFAGMLAGFMWSIYKSQQYKHDYKGFSDTSPTLEIVWRSILNSMPFILFFGLVSLSFHYKPPGVPELNDLALTLLIFTLSYAILSALLKPNTKLDRKPTGLVPSFPETSKKLFFWARLFLFATLLGALFYSPLFDTTPPNSLVGLIRIALGTLTGLALIRLIWLLQPSLAWMRQYRLHLIGTLVIVIAIGALWLGYRNFAIFLFTGTFGTLFILLVGWLLLRIPTEIYDGMDEGHAPWQLKLREQLGLDDKEIIPGLIWLRLLTFIIVLVVILILLLLVWGMSEQSIRSVLAQAANGIQIGNFKFEPIRILIGLLTLSILLGLTHIIKTNLANSWLNRTNLSRGAKEAIVTISGYAGILLSIFIGLSVAGINFSNLAIIAGALSVGIGFGLQNIVNNFISGIILLFERPIRRGDWIRVGASEGYVRDISIRSTVIQTFDRSDIIVPNSELISNQVTNMMLNNQYGRIIIPIGVAYGSDVDLVMRTLYNVAAKHPMVLREHGELKIQVFFRSFGDSALNFELRCQIKDVEKILQVTSELNIAIEKAFRETRIDIPFPQRSVHVIAEHLDEQAVLKAAQKA